PLYLFCPSDPHSVGALTDAEGVSRCDLYRALSARNRRIHVRRHRGSSSVCVRRLHDGMAGLAACGLCAMASVVVLSNPSTVPATVTAASHRSVGSVGDADTRRSSGNDRASTGDRRRIRDLDCSLATRTRLAKTTSMAVGGGLSDARTGCRAACSNDP